jgi:hypothetical protein
VWTGNEYSKPIWNKVIIRKDIIETSRVVLNFYRTVYYSVGYNNCKYMTKDVPELYETFVGFYDNSRLIYLYIRKQNLILGVFFNFMFFLG